MVESGELHVLGYFSDLGIGIRNCHTYGVCGECCCCCSKAMVLDVESAVVVVARRRTCKRLPERITLNKASRRGVVVFNAIKV